MGQVALSASRGRPMPQSIPAGLTRTHVLQALADIDAGVDHPFGQPTGYELLHEGKRYPPKAVVGLACRYSLGRILLPEEFSGGEALRSGMVRMPENFHPITLEVLDEKLSMPGQSCGRPYPDCQ